jgi:hypothetical protein
MGKHSKKSKEKTGGGRENGGRWKKLRREDK